MEYIEMVISAKMLNLAGDEFANHGCNDVDETFWEGWTTEKRKRFVKEYHDWNGDPEEYNPLYLHLPDYAIMDFLAYKLLNHTQNNRKGTDTND